MQGVALEYLFQESLKTQTWILLGSVVSVLFRKKKPCINYQIVSLT